MTGIPNTHGSRVRQRKLWTGSASGQAVTEYALILAFMLFVLFALGGIRRTNPAVASALVQIIQGFGIYSDSYDFVLSLPIP